MITYKRTLYACYVGYITQAIVNNLPPLLFVTFTLQFDISLGMIGLLIAINFITQIITDAITARFVDRTGYKIPMIMADVFSVSGLISFSMLPFIIEPFIGLALSMILCAIGGGLCEVLVSPIVESLPIENKVATMNFLHSFYSWGQAAVVLLSTIFFIFFKTEAWRFLPVLFSIIPFIDGLLFIEAPMYSLIGEKEEADKHILRNHSFRVFLIIMICAGANEITMSQWSSLFAEEALGVSKTMGDLLGPMSFALCMGLSRLYFGIKGENIKIENGLIASSILCIISYLLVVLSPVPLLSLGGCALCGLAVGLMWTGTFSLVTRSFPKGGAGAFAYLALAGDIGCTHGPFMTGQIAGLLTIDQSISLRLGLSFSIIFPLTMFLMLIKKKRKQIT